MKHLGNIITALVILTVLGSLAVVGGPTFWHLAGESAVRPAELKITQAVLQTDQEQIDLSSTIALAPFGRNETEAPENTAPTATTLDLALRGVVSHADPALSYALISANGKTQSYLPQDTVAKDAVLVEIAERHVILEVNGEQQFLGFPNADLASLSDSDTSGPEMPVSNLDRLRTALGAGTGSYEAPIPPPPETTEDYIDMWRERIIRNPNQVLGEIGLIASEKGYTVDENHDPGVKLAGLKVGDRVARVNGQAVGNVEQDRKYFDEVAASGVARIEVVRDGRTFVMSFPLK